MSYRICQNSFSKGIISPSLQGRVDLEQYKLGVKNLKNGIEEKPIYLELFFHNLILGENNELKNRYIHIDYLQ